MQANIFVDFPETARKDGLCTPEDFWGGRWRPSYGPLGGLLEGKELRSEESGMMNAALKVNEGGRIHWRAIFRFCSCVCLQQFVHIERQQRHSCLGNTCSTTSITIMQLDRPEAYPQRYLSLEFPRITNAVCCQQNNMFSNYGFCFSGTKYRGIWEAVWRKTLLPLGETPIASRPMRHGRPASKINLF